MAASAHTTIRLDTDLTGILPTNTYGVVYDGLEQIYQPAITIERSLTGKAHVHRVLDSGTPVVFDGHQYRLLLTLAEKEQLAADIGKVCYFMPHYRDEADVDYRVVVTFRAMRDVKNIDPMLRWWYATIELEQTDGVTVG